MARHIGQPFGSRTGIILIYGVNYPNSVINFLAINSKIHHQRYRPCQRNIGQLSAQAARPVAKQKSP